jgi:hypothetical protein
MNLLSVTRLPLSQEARGFARPPRDEFALSWMASLCNIYSRGAKKYLEENFLRSELATKQQQLSRFFTVSWVYLEDKITQVQRQDAAYVRTGQTASSSKTTPSLGLSVQ